MTQEDFEVKLSFVSLSDDNITMLLNGDSKYPVKLPSNISKKNSTDKMRIVASEMLGGCTDYKLDYVSEDNINRRTKEVVDQLYERARVTKNYVPQPLHPTFTDQYGNDYFEYLIDCVKRTVKEENALIRQVMYTTLSSYGNDPINLGVLAPTSTGKTYPIVEAVKYTPRRKEVRIVGSMTPKVLIREQGVLVDRDGNPIGKEVRRLKNAIAEAKRSKSKNASKALEEYQDELAALLEDSAYVLDMSNKTLIFLEPPHPELWNLLKPILSHDAYEMEHPFVEKIATGGMEVKRVITRGWPACIFCSAKDESKWDIWPEIESRFMLASPNMIKPKYQAGNRLIAQKKGLPKGIKQQVIISDTAKELGHKSFLYLKYQIQQYTNATDSPVWIPFGERLAEILPADKGQDNRAANRFFTMLNIIALAKAHLRHKLIFGDEELVIATLQDLRETLHVMQNMTGIPPHKLRFYQQYILPLYKAKDSQKLETKEICDFYNANNKKGTLQMNSDNLRKNYLQELVNHNYLEQEQDENTKATKYLYTPLVDVDDNDEQEEEQQEALEGGKPPTSPTLEQVFEKLHFSKLLLPENHTGIPEDWLNQEILQLSDRLRTSAPLKILDPKGYDIPTDDFIRTYEPQNGGLKLKDFVKLPRFVGDSNSVNITTSDSPKGGRDANITKTEEKKEEKSQTQPKVSQAGDLDVLALVNKTVGDKGYFTRDDWLFTTQMEPNLGWTEDEAEQILYSLLEEGKIRETDIGTGQFELTTTES
jgi:hypothetical protein